MAKPYNVTPVIPPGRQSYVATFRNATGKRITRGLATDDLSRANLVCAGLTRLTHAGTKSLSAVPSDVPLESVRLYFDQNPSRSGELHLDAQIVDAALPTVHAQLQRYPPHLRQELFLVLLDRERLRRENTLQVTQQVGLKRELDREREQRVDLERSALGRAVKAGQNMPALDEALALFEQHMLTSTSVRNAKTVVGVARAFTKQLAADGKKLTEVTLDDLARFLDLQVAKGTSGKQVSRRDALRRRLGRFINWGAQRYEYPSPMQLVRAVSKVDLDREKGDIHWHTMEQVDAAIAQLPDDYWKALVGTLAFAGLQLAELCWLRTADVELESSAPKLWITTVQDPEVPEVTHLLKTGHRRRSVRIHSRCLLPLLREFVAKGYAGKFYFFALPPQSRRRPRAKSPGCHERWLTNTLSIVLRGHHGGKGHLPKAGLLPAGMTAKSLRRTFGSLLLRSGKSCGEVAAAMGNTEDVVRNFYARIHGGEVEIDF